MIKSQLAKSPDYEFELFHKFSLDDACEDLKTKQFSEVDFVLLDLNLPGSSGPDTIAKILDLHLKAPVIVMTGLSQDQSTYIKSLQEGVQDYLVKGEFDSHTLIKTIYNAIQRKKLQNQLDDKIFEAETAIKTKAEFLARMSHEIRTPMHGVLGYVDLLQHTDLDPYQISCLSKLNSAGRALLKLVDDILDVTRIETGKLRFNNQPFSLVETLENSIALIETQLKKKDVKINYTLNEGTPEILIGDEHRIQQVFLNILGNASKFTEKGRIDVHIRHEAIGPAKARIYVDIADTGVGIPAHRKDHIFDLFEQGDNASDRKFGGAGLGLTITQQLIEMMGGKISLTSEENVGTTVSFEISFETAGQLSLQVISKPEQSTQNTQGYILIVEDIPMNQELALAMLHQHGHSGAIAKNGQEAVDMIRKQNFDLILMDIQMPKMDGLEATRFIREELNKSYDSLPIIMMTAHAIPEQIQQAYANGANAYLIKPIQSEELHKALCYWLDSDSFDSFEEALMNAPDDDETADDHDFSVIDDTQIEAMQKLIGKEKINDFIRSFEQDYYIDCDKNISQSVPLDDLKKHLHSLASSAGNLGMHSVCRLSKKIVEDILDNETQTLDQSLGILKEDIEKSFSIIRGRFSTQAER